MKKSLIFIALGIFFLFIPNIALSEVELKNNDIQLLLGSARQQVVSQKYLDLLITDNISDLEKQIASLLIKKALEKEGWNYAMVEMPQEILLLLVKKSGLLLALSLGDEGVKTIIEEIEKESVKKAVEIAKDWFLQKEIKIASGVLSNYSYKSYKGTEEKPIIGYNIVYHPNSEKEADVSIEFHSPKEIYPPNSNGAYTMYGTYWSQEEWQRLNKKSLPPFIIRIKGKTIKGEGGGYSWQKPYSIDIIFDEPVPEVEYKELTFFEKITSKIKEKLEEPFSLIEQILDIGKKNLKIFGAKTNDILNKLGSIFKNLALFKAQVSFDSVLKETEIDLAKINFDNIVFKDIEQITDKSADLRQEIINTEYGYQDKEQDSFNLEKAQEIVDDISEKIDILSQKLGQMAENTIETSLSFKEANEEESVIELSIESDEENEDDKDDYIEDNKEEQNNQIVLNQESSQKSKTTKKYTGGGSKQEISYCEKSQQNQAFRDKVVINEVSWMGTEESSSDEWIELKNITDNPISLSGWQLLDREKQIKIVFGENDVIAPNGFYLLERTDDNSVPIAPANFIYTGALNDSNEALYLFGNECRLEDETAAEPEWPAGDKEEKLSMERGLDLSWHSYTGLGEFSIMGTPKAENSQPFIEESKEDSAFPTAFFNFSSSSDSLTFNITFEIKEGVREFETPSGISGFSLRWREKDNESWTEFEYQEVQDGPVTYLGDKEFIGLDEKGYYFQIKAKDIAGNESDWLPESGFLIEISIDKTLIITEILLKDDEFIELYNYGEQDINVSNCYLSYFSSDRDWNNPWRKKKFSDNTIINKKSYYLIGLKGYPVLDGNPNSDWQPYSNAQLNNDLGAVAVFPWDPEDKTIEEANLGRIDAVGWGGINVKEKEAADLPQEGESLQREINKEGQGYQDTDNNKSDFESGLVSPLNSKNEDFIPSSHNEHPWPAFLHDSQNHLNSPFTGLKDSLDPKPEIFIGGKSNDYFYNPFIDSNSNLYFSARINDKQGIYSFNQKGYKKWFFEGALHCLYVAGLDNDLIYIFNTCSDKKIIALDREGKVRWEKVYSDFTPRLYPNFKDNRIYLFADSLDSSSLIALNSLNGEMIWSYEIGSRIGAGNFPPTIAQNDIIYFGVNNILYAVSSDGSEKWRKEFPAIRLDGSETKDSLVGVPTIGLDGTIYVIIGREKEWQTLTDGGWKNCLHALDPDTQDEKWPELCDKFFGSSPISVSSSGNIYFSGGYSPAGSWITKLFGFNPDGSSLSNWPLNLGYEGINYFLTIDNDELIYGIFNNKLKVINSKGVEKHSINLEDNRIGPVALNGDGSVFISGAKKMYIIIKH
ncbi:MAG: lamin tail domain-containing protein [Candidatus Pacebacteria bacterium]|nr:lamin tail domain-containing protein [Candidatus Paceibacterota bacterium]